MRMRRKPNLASRMEKCSHLLVSAPGTLQGIWKETYAKNSIHLEIGCGKGNFINAAAAAAPDILFIALEKSDNVLISAMEKAVSCCISNIRFICSPAEMINTFFSNGEIDRIYINFCDPWPSNRHIKRRLTSSSFLQIYRDILCTCGEIHFKTDNRALFDFSLCQFEENNYALLEYSKNLHSEKKDITISEYEQKFMSMHQPIYWCRVRV